MYKQKKFIDIIPGRQKTMHEWASSNGPVVQQRGVKQETAMAKEGNFAKKCIL